MIEYNDVCMIREKEKKEGWITILQGTCDGENRVCHVDDDCVESHVKSIYLLRIWKCEAKDDEGRWKYFGSNAKKLDILVIL